MSGVFLSRYSVHTCSWCGKERRDRLSNQQQDGSIICLPCLVTSHPNLEAHIDPKTLDEVKALIESEK